MILRMSSFLWSWFQKLCMAGILFTLGWLNTCVFVILPYSFYHEMLDFNPMDLKFYMLILDTLMDVLGLVWYFLMYQFCFMLVLAWCDNLCHTFGCSTCTIWFPCQMTSNASDFLHDGCFGCVECSWIFPELFESFLFWLGIFILNVQMCALNWSLTSLAYYMNLPIDFGLVLFRTCSWLFKYDSC